MAGIKNIDLKVISGVSLPRAEVTVTVSFSPREQAMGLEYRLWVTLYDQDLGRDEEWLYPNFPYMPSDRWAATDKDDHLLHMPGRQLVASQSEVIVTLSADLSRFTTNSIEALPAIARAINNDSDNNFAAELYARAIVIPETSYAVKYTRSQIVHAGQLTIPS